MRVKTNAQRQAIIDAAIQVFHELGYTRASMSGIAARVGGSKATLYNYFKSKEELLIASMKYFIEVKATPIIDLMGFSDEDLPTLIHQIGMKYTQLMHLPDPLIITRTAIVEGTNAELCALLYQHGPSYALDQFAVFLKRLMDKNLIRPVEPRVAALHFKGLLDAGFMEPLLFGVEPEISMDDGVAIAVDVFLRAYGVEQKNLP